MNKIFYMTAATVRIIGPYISRFSAVVRKLMVYMTARTQTGITARLWMAVVMSVCALLFNIFYLEEEFDRLPAFIPLLFDIEGNIAGWGHKSMLNGYTELRIAFFLVMALIGWGICKAKGGTLLSQRIRLLVIDIANLVITTGVSMAYICLRIAQGSHNEKLAEEWEYAVMCFWLLTLVIEYFSDKKYCRFAP